MLDGVDDEALRELMGRLVVREARQNALDDMVDGIATNLEGIKSLDNLLTDNPSSHGRSFRHSVLSTVSMCGTEHIECFMFTTGHTQQR
jgi:hypothetical protein